MFGKEKMYLGSFLRLLDSSVLNLPNPTYQDYLAFDRECVLSEKEYKEFNVRLSLFRLLLLSSRIMDLTSKGIIKASISEVGSTFYHALELAYGDIGFDKEATAKKLQTYMKETDEFIKYLNDLDYSNPNYDMTHYASIYFSEKFTKSNNLPEKNGTYVTLINNNRRIINELFDLYYKKVKIIL